MGEIRKQSIQNSLIQYIGIGLGYFNSVILFTAILDTEQYGLTRVFMAISMIFVNFGSLGSSKILLRFFPYFRTDDHRHKGFLVFATILSLAGFLFASFLYLLLKGLITNHYADSTPLFIEYYLYVIILSLSMLLTNVLENFMMAKKETVLPYFLKNIFIRLVWILIITLYYYDFYDFNTFIFFFSSTYMLNFLIMLVQQFLKEEIKINRDVFKMRFRVVKVLINYGVYSIVTGISTILVNRIDIIMITFLLDLTSTSIYSIAYYISTVIFVPANSLYRISVPVVAEQWKNKNFSDMLVLYEKSCINQILLGGFVFLCIWVNIDYLFTYLKPEYAEGKWIVLILSISVLYTMSMGINNIIAMITKYYRYDTYASIMLAILTVVTNFIFIPLMGLKGAAIATLISVTAYQTFKFILILVKFKMQPFNKKTLLALFTIGVSYLVVYFIPRIFDMVLMEIVFRCFVITVIFIFLVRLLRISSDMNAELNKVLVKLRIK